MTNREHYVVNCSILFTELPLLDRALAAAEAGFRQVEFWWPFEDPVPSSTQIDAFAAAIEDAGVHLFALNLYGGNMAAGERGVLSSPPQRSVFRDNVDVVVELGHRLHINACNALYGNRNDGIEPAVQDECAVEQLIYAANAVSSFGGRVLLEPLSAIERYPLRLAADAVAVIEAVERVSECTNIKLLADLYHLAVNGDDIAAAIARYADRVGHVQIADAPGRHQPGTGELPLAQWIAALRAASFDGPISLEYLPTNDTKNSFSWIGDF